MSELPNIKSLLAKQQQEKPPASSQWESGGGRISRRFPSFASHASPISSRIGVRLIIGLSNPFVIFLEDYGLVPTNIKVVAHDNIQAVPSLSGACYAYIFPAEPFEVVLGGIILRNVVLQDASGADYTHDLRPHSLLVYLKTKISASYGGAVCTLSVISNTSNDSGAQEDLLYVRGFLRTVSFGYNDPESKIGAFELTFLCVP